MTGQAEIMELERRFWQAMVDMDVDAAIALLDEPAMSANAHGIHHFTPAEYKAMALSEDARITEFEFFDERVLFPTPDVAIASYRARQAFTAGGEHVEMLVHDTTTWVRKGDRWLAAGHTESPAE